MKIKSIRGSFLIVALALLTIFSTAAALSNPIISWNVMASGGGLSSNGSIVIQDTIGQPIVDISTGGEYSLNAGYWVPLGTYISVFLPIILR